MNYVLKRIILVAGLFFSASLQSDDWSLDDLHYTQMEEDTGSGRSYHAAVHDVVTGKESNPFMFTTSRLGHASRASSSLLGYLYAAAEDSVIREHLMDDMEGFCEKVLNFYVLGCQALVSAQEQLDDAPEKGAYLLDRVEEFRRSLILLHENFSVLVEDMQSDQISAVLVVLTSLIKKTGQMLAL